MNNSKKTSEHPHKKESFFLPQCGDLSPLVRTLMQKQPNFHSQQKLRYFGLSVTTNQSHPLFSPALESQAKHVKLPLFPEVDTIDYNQKIVCRRNNPVNLHSLPSKAIIAGVFLFHLLFFFSFYGYSYLKDYFFPSPIEEVMMVTLNNSIPFETLTPSEEKVAAEEATKTAKELTQLTKNVTVMSPNLTDSPNALPPDKNGEETERIKDQMENKGNVDLKEILKVKIKNEDDNKKISVEEYMKRKEIDERKIAEKKKDGGKDKPEDKEKKNKNKGKMLETIPDSPFAKKDDMLPAAPLTLSTATSTSANSSEMARYQAIIMEQLKNNWLQTAGRDFSDETLEVVLKIKINTKGAIEDVSFVKKSQVEDFNKAVIHALERSSPFPSPPKELSNMPFIQIRYTSKDTK